MRTTIELPDELMIRAKVKAAQDGISLKDLFVSAVEQHLAPAPKRVRRDPPVIITGGPVRDATREEIEESMFPIQHIIDDLERRRR